MHVITAILTGVPLQGLTTAPPIFRLQERIPVLIAACAIQTDMPEQLLFAATVTPQRTTRQPIPTILPSEFPIPVQPVIQQNQAGSLQHSRFTATIIRLLADILLLKITVLVVITGITILPRTLAVAVIQAISTRPAIQTTHH